MDKKKYFGDLMLFLAAFIWGTAFVAQVTGMDRIGPFTFKNGIVNSKSKDREATALELTLSKLSLNPSFLPTASPRP